MFKAAIAKTLNKATELATPGTKEAIAKVSKNALETGVVEMGGLVPIVVVLLRNHAVDGVFNILEKFPGGSLLADTGKILFKSTINKFNDVLHENGEPCLMNTIATIWKDKAVCLGDLRVSIDKIPDNIANLDVKREALLLVEKYHQNTVI